MIWTAARMEQAKQLWAEGCSGGEIAHLMQRKLTRSAVLGKLWRMGVIGRGPSFAVRPKALPKIVAPKPKRERKMNVPIVPVLLPVLVIPHVPNPTPLSLATDNQCREIPGEPVADALICGAIVKVGTSWCPFHHSRLLYRSDASKRREPISSYRQYVVAA